MLSVPVSRTERKGKRSVQARFPCENVAREKATSRRAERLLFEIESLLRAIREEATRLSLPCNKRTWSTVGNVKILVLELGPVDALPTRAVHVSKIALEKLCVRSMIGQGLHISRHKMDAHENAKTG
jgi:hypothetical protein